MPGSPADPPVGAGNKGRGGRGIGGFAFLAPDTLVAEEDQAGHEFHVTLVMPIADEISLPATSTFDHMELEAVYGLVIKLL